MRDKELKQQLKDKEIYIVGLRKQNQELQKACEELREECDELNKRNNFLLQRLEVDDTETSLVFKLQRELENSNSEFYFAVKSELKYKRALDELKDFIFSNDEALDILGSENILAIINKAKDKICYWDKNIDMSKATLQVDGKVICRFDNDNQMVIINDNYSDTTKRKEKNEQR